MSVCIFDGKCIVQELLECIGQCVVECKVVGLVEFGLVVVLVGDDVVLLVYVCNKCKVCYQVGFCLFDFDLFLVII